MYKKKFLSFLLILSLVLLLTGCLNNTIETSSQKSTFISSLIKSKSSSSSESSVSTETDTETQSEKTTVMESGEATQTSKRYNTMDIESSSSSSRTTTSTDTETEPSSESEATISHLRLSDIFNTDFFTTTAATTVLHGNEFFNDAVFIGDSVTLGLKNYTTSERNNGRECLGKAKFLCAGSMGYTNSRRAVGTKNSIHPKYQGKEMLIEDAVKATGAKKVFIMLGMNDFAGYNSSTVKKNVLDTINKIVEKNPNVQIFVESVTPITKSKEHGNFTNTNIDKFNETLKSICKDNSWEYVDISSQLKGDSNALKPEYCGDNTSNGMGIHMSFKGCKVWVSYLLNKF